MVGLLSVSTSRSDTRTGSKVGPFLLSTSYLTEGSSHSSLIEVMNQTSYMMPHILSAENILDIIVVILLGFAVA